MKRRRVSCARSATDASAVPSLGKALRDDDADLRFNAALALSKMGAPALSKFIEGLRDRNPDVRILCAKQIRMAGFKDTQAVAALVNALNDSVRRVRKEAVLCLGAIGDRRALPALVKTLNDLDKNVRLASAYALEKIGDERALPALRLVSNLTSPV